MIRTLAESSPLLFMAALLLATSISSQAIDDFGDEELLDVPEVLTAVRLRQPRAEAPGSISVITREMIKASGLRDLAEVMRLVPGMMVAPYFNYEHRVSYHGTSSHESRRMQVLVDGRSVYQPAVASVKWSNIPVSIQDIERIEVVRGPATASYGANAFLGAINIITQHPSDTHGWQLSTTQGKHETSDYYARYGAQAGNNNYRITLASEHDSGYDELASGVEQHDDKDYKTASFRSVWQKNNQTNIDFQIGVKDGTNQRPKPDGDEDLYLTFPDADLETRFVSIQLNQELSQNHSYYLKAYHRELTQDVSWQTCVPSAFLLDALGEIYRIDNDYTNLLVAAVSAGQSPPAHPTSTAINTILLPSLFAQIGALTTANTCGKANENYKQAQSDIEIQDTLRINKQLRMVNGFSLREDMGRSETYLNGTQTNTSARAFTNIEWHPLERIMFNISGMYEWERENDNNFSPRIAINYRINSNETLRMAYSEATRTPDMFEKDADWSYTVRNLSPQLLGQDSAKYYVSAQAPGRLKNEQARSREVGYYGFFPTVGLAIDIKLFNDHYSQLISDNLTLVGFDADNFGELKQYGAEIEIDYKPSNDILVRLVYSHIDNSLITDTSEDNLTAENAASLLTNYRFNNHWSAGIAIYYANQINDYKFSRTDYRVSYTHQIGDVLGELSLLVQHRNDDDPELYDNNLYDSNSQAFLSATLGF